MTQPELPSARVVGGVGAQRRAAACEIEAKELAIQNVLGKRMSTSDQAAFDEYERHSRARRRSWKLVAAGAIAIIALCRAYL